MGAEADAAKAKTSRPNKDGHKEVSKDKEVPKDRNDRNKRPEKAADKPAASAAAPAKAADKPAASAAAPAKAPTKDPPKAAPPKEAAASGRRAEAPTKEKARPAATAAERIGGYQPARPALPTKTESLSEEALQQVAQAKFEAQEEKLKDVTRFSMVLLRDFAKGTPAERAKRVSDAQKALFRYEMQYTRAWGYTEERRIADIAKLEEEAEQCKKAAAEEELQIVELRRILENERRRRERYEGYEATALEVNRKRSRDEYTNAIAETKEGIEELKRRRTAHDGIIEERMQRAQLLAHAVAELKEDLRKEKDNLKDILKGSGEAAEDASPTAASAAADPVQLDMQLEMDLFMSRLR